MELVEIAEVGVLLNEMTENWKNHDSIDIRLPSHWWDQKAAYFPNFEFCVIKWTFWIYLKDISEFNQMDSLAKSSVFSLEITKSSRFRKRL